ncbi:hypothetical protein [Sphingobacterium deserti]|uniref:Outer membrane protein beta-barrel domain-containing protein n=1 Tax=Sphingobacterium deserti TaxID=1229276 RepID=A0A0B8TBL8_9SPHI|nr:hypothetical protein [Sphingobacterium deserti]KGE15625.1 hypothetical protein DI53_0729 [Sphingobacterium deserti]
MKTYCLTLVCKMFVVILLSLLSSLAAEGQIPQAKDHYFKIGIAVQRALGGVNIKGSGETFYGNIFPEGIEQVQTNREDNYWRPLSLSYGKYITDRYSLGLGAEIDTYGLGDRTRSSLPIFLEGAYNFGLSGSGTFFVNVKPGYSIGIESTFHSGVKVETAIGYEFNKRQERRVSYGISLGYNYQELRKVRQVEMRNIQGTGMYTEVGERFVNVALSSVPIIFFIRL